MSSIQEAVKQAQESAAAIAAAASSNTQVIEGSVSTAGVVTTFSKPSMATVASGTGVIPRSALYLKVNEFGIRVGKDKEFITELQGNILMTEDKGFQLKQTLRFGNPATYLSTFDGRTCDKGGAWSDACIRARLADPTVEPYYSVDIVVQLTKDIKLKAGPVKAGTVVAINTAKTNFSEWQDYYIILAEAGRLGETVPTKIGFRDIAHNGNTWGVFTFELAK